MTRGLKHWGDLLKLREDLGPIYGSEELCVLLYSLARRDKPRSIVEIGTGLGVCTCWIANALRENGSGRILSMDDGRDFDSTRSVRAAARNLIAQLDGRQGRREELTYSRYLRRIASRLHLSAHITFLPIAISNAKDILSELPAGKIDWVFSDFSHGPETIIELLNAFLPRMRAPASIFIDSASTYWPSYQILEKIVRELNAGGRRSEILDAAAVRSLATRRVTLTHLIEAKRRKQNSTAWIRLEPADWKPLCRDK